MLIGAHQIRANLIFRNVPDDYFCASTLDKTTTPQKASKTPIVEQPIESILEWSFVIKVLPNTVHNKPIAVRASPTRFFLFFVDKSIRSVGWY